MWCKNFCGRSRVLSATTYIDEIVRLQTQQGTQTTRAIEVAADALGLPRRWVYSRYYGQRAADRKLEAVTLRARFAAWIRADIEKSERIIAERRAMLRALEDADAMAAPAMAAGCAGSAALVEGDR